MSPEQYMSAHEGNFGGYLKIRFISGERDLVTAEMRTSRHHLTVGGRVHGGAIMAFADAVAAYGTVINLPSPEHSTTTLESKTNFFAAGMGKRHRAEARPMHIGRSTMVWETRIFGIESRCIALVVQTQMILSPPSTSDATMKHSPKPRRIRR